jgi:hypothetical protein
MAIAPQKTSGDGRRWMPPEPAPDPLGVVVRDAIDHTREIVRDSVAIGTLEVRRAARGAKQVAGDLGPRIAWGAAAATLGVIGAIVGLIAVFIGAEVIIPSVAARLGIIAGLFLALAAFGAWRAARGTKRDDAPRGASAARPVRAALPEATAAPHGTPLHSEF